MTGGAEMRRAWGDIILPAVDDFAPELIIVSAGFVSSVLEYSVSRWIITKVEVLTVPLSPSLQVHKEWIVCGLLVLVLAAIWKEAVRMAEEQSLTV